MKRRKSDRECRASEAAERLVDYYGITRPAEIRLVDIAMDRGVFVHSAPLKGMDGFLLRKGSKGIIRVRSGIRLVGQRRFVVAHELGHWELHSDLSQAWVATAEDINDYGGSAAELEANAFASTLLMPPKLFDPMAHDVRLSFQAVAKLAEEFQTTITAAAVRLIEATRRDWYVVFSQGDVIKWFRSSPHGTGQFVKPGARVPEQSLANQTAFADELSPGLREVAASTWFPCLKRASGLELYEQSVVLTEDAYTITLLSLVSRPSLGRRATLAARVDEVGCGR